MNGFREQLEYAIIIKYVGLVTFETSALCSAVAEMDDRLATIDMGRKLGAVPLFGGGAGSLCNTMWPGGRGLPPYQVAS